MKKNYLSITLFFLFTVLYGQDPTANHALGRSVFNDAKSLTELVKKYDAATNSPEKTAAEGEISEILKPYFNSTAEIVSFNKKYGTKLPEINLVNTLRGMANTNSIQGTLGLGAIGNPTIAIDALGTFIANRFKQEINIAFLNKLKEDLNTLPYLKELFPASTKVLLAGDPYNYPVFIGMLEQAFHEDINNLPQNIISELKNKYPTNDFVKIVGPLTSIKTLNSVHEVVNQLASQVYTAANLTTSFAVLAISLNAIYKGGTGAQMFISGDDLTSLMDSNFMGMYVPLLIRQNELYFEETGILTKVTPDVSGYVLSFVSIYQSIAAQAQYVNSEITKQGKLSPETLQKAQEELLNSFSQVIAAAEALNVQGLDLTGIKGAFKNIESINATYKYIVEKKYGLAIFSAVEIINSYAVKKLTVREQEKWNRYAGFINNMLTAETKEELMAALETSANPVGSYRVKRNATVNISINAFAGGFCGVAANEKPLYGFTAPVGVYLGLGNIGKSNPLYGNRGKSLGVFLPFVDVGAVTAFRVTDGETELADVSWDNVFAPGAYLTYGFGKCPISLNVGGQLGPELKTVNSDGTTVLTDKIWYWRASIVVDIPLFDLFTHQKAYDKDK